jgi:hypothetical protein
MKQRHIAIIAALISLLLSINVMADALGKADAAVSDILFGFDGSEEYATYRANDDGSVDLVFARNTPDELYDKILTELQSHPDIRSVLASKGGPACKLF